MFITGGMCVCVCVAENGGSVPLCLVPLSLAQNNSSLWLSEMMVTKVRGNWASNLAMVM